VLELKKKVAVEGPEDWSTEKAGADRDGTRVQLPYEFAGVGMSRLADKRNTVHGWELWASRGSEVAGGGGEVTGVRTLSTVCAEELPNSLQGVQEAATATQEVFTGGLGSVHEMSTLQQPERGQEEGERQEEHPGPLAELQGE
jgi:hypothetical protein